mgnify:CR=1 FL=1
MPKHDATDPTSPAHRPARNATTLRGNPTAGADGPRGSVRRVSGFSYAAARVIVLGLAALTGGCAGPSTGDGLLATRGETAMVIADWNDVDAAVEHGALTSEMAIVERLPPEPDRRVFRLRTIGDEPAVLIVTRATAPRSDRGVDGVGSTTGVGGPEGMKLEARVGRFGDRAKEERLVNAVRARLGRLPGVDYAPLP